MFCVFKNTNSLEIKGLKDAVITQKTIYYSYKLKVVH